MSRRFLAALPLISLLLLPSGNAQPTKSKSQAKEQQANSQSTATPPNEGRSEVNNPANATSSSHSQKSNPENDPFQAEQLRQSGIITTATVWIAIFGGLSFIAVAVYAIFSFKQFRAIDRQATRAGEQVDKMQGQLDVMNRQAETSDKLLTETSDLVSHNEGMVRAMQEQLEQMTRQAKVMEDGLIETQKATLHNEKIVEAMRDQVKIIGIAVEPRLRISNVRVEDFEVGKWPVFIVSIANEGATDARDVWLQLRVNFREGGTLAQKWSRPQIVTISARQEQHYFLEWNNPLTQEGLEAKTLKVSGIIKIGDSEAIKFCYRYYRWKGKRPEGVSQFVPCDFDPGLTYVQTHESFRLKLESQTPEDNNEADDEDDNENPS